MKHLRLPILLTALSLGLFSSPLAASSKIWEGEIRKVQGTRIHFKPQYTPYASANLYPTFCDTADKEGQLLSIDFSEKSSNPVHVPCIDDIPVLSEELLAAAKPGMRIIGFMNRKQWHYVSLVVRDAQVEVGYVVNQEKGVLTMRRPQADWPAQSSNRISHSAKEFPDRIFEIPLPTTASGDLDPSAIQGAEHLQPGQSAMILPAAAMRVEWIPNAAERWNPQVEPLKGNFDEYPKRSDPDIDQTFYQHAVTGTLLDGETVKRSLVNWEGSNPKEYPSWKLDVPYGPKQGEYILPSRGHKTKEIIAGHFNGYPKIPALKAGRRVSAWSYRTQRAANWLWFDAHEMQVEGKVISREGSRLRLMVSKISGEEEVEVTLSANATFHSLGQSAQAADVLAPGNIVRIYPERPFTLIPGS